MTKLTIRAKESDELVIDSLKEFLGEKASTKALLRAAELVPKQAREIEALKRKNQKLCGMLVSYQEAGNNVTQALETFRLNDAALEKAKRVNYMLEQTEFDL